MRVRNGRNNNDTASYVFAPGEERENNQGGDNQNLHNDGNQERALPIVADTGLLCGITFNETVAEKAGTFFGNGSNSHHTPPEISP